MNQLAVANRNIKLYIFVRIFAKRVFLPLTAIYFMSNAGFSIRDIGLLSGFYSVIQLLAEVPTGYFADRLGRVASIRMGAILAAVATICYIVFKSKSGIFLGAMFEALGYSFFGGAGEALIHDSLVVKKQVKDYTKILSRTMSISLIANAVLIAFVPMTYTLDHRYPFLIGTVAYLLLFTVTLFMHDVETQRVTSVIKLKIPDLKKIVGKRHLLIFGLTFGIISALYSSPNDMFNLALKEYGIRIEYIGWIYSAGSILGAAIGPFFHYLRGIRLSRYIILDILVLLSLYIASYSRSVIALAVIMVMAISFWRYRRIIYQDYLLTIYPTEYKATLISAMNNLEQLNSIWLPIAITYLIYQTNISQGFGLVGIFTLLIAPIFYYSTRRFFKIDRKAMVLANGGPDIV
jgi:MFS family permease